MNPVLEPDLEPELGSAWILTIRHTSRLLVERSDGQRRLPPANRSQFSRNSGRCSIAHSNTSDSTRLGSRPPSTSNVSIANVAWCSAYST